MMKRAYKNKIITGAFLLCAGFAALFFFKDSYLPTETKEPQQIKNLYAEKYEGFSKNTKISRTIFSPSSETKEKEIFIQNPKKPLLINADHNIYKSKNIYNIEYKIHENNENLIDLSFLINKKKKLVKINLSGLNNKEKVTLMFDKKIIYDVIPVDWSGKITLSAPLNNENKNEPEICARIQQQNNIKTICHRLKQKGNIV